MGKIFEGINFCGWAKPIVITIANSTCVQIFVGLIFVGVAAHENQSRLKISAFTVYTVYRVIFDTLKYS